MKFTLIVLVAMVACCMSAVPLDDNRGQTKATADAVAEPELVLAQPLNPALLADAPVPGIRLVRQAYDDVNVDVVSSKLLSISHLKHSMLT